MTIEFIKTQEGTIVERDEIAIALIKKSSYKTRIATMSMKDGSYTIDGIEIQQTEEIEL